MRRMVAEMDDLEEIRGYITFTEEEKKEEVKKEDAEEEKENAESI